MEKALWIYPVSFYPGHAFYPLSFIYDTIPRQVIQFTYLTAYGYASFNSFSECSATTIFNTSISIKAVSIFST